MLQWEGMEVNSHLSDCNEAVLREVEENQSFMEFVENYEQAYMYNEEDDKSGGYIGKPRLLN